MLFPISRVPIPTICLVLAGFPITPALWGAFCGFPREYLTPAHVCLLSRIFGFSLDTVERLPPPRAQPNLPTPASIASDLHAQPIYIPLHPFYPFYARRFPVSRVPIPTICLVLAESPITSALWVHFAAFPASILHPLMFVYCPECYSGILVFPPSVLLCGGPENARGVLGCTSRFPSREIPAFTPYTFHSAPIKSPQKAILFA